MDKNFAILDWDAFVDAKLSVLTNIPQPNHFLGTKIFVGECYPHYYDIVSKLLMHFTAWSL